MAVWFVLTRVAGAGGKPTAAEGFLMRVRWRGLELPNRVHSERGTLSDTYGKFYVEPFERGFGMTIGIWTLRQARSLIPSMTRAFSA